MGTWLEGMGTVLAALLVTAVYGSALGLVFCALRRLFGTGLNARVRMLGWWLFAALLFLILLTRLHPSRLLRGHLSNLYYDSLLFQFLRRLHEGSFASLIFLWPWNVQMGLMVFTHYYPAPGMEITGENWLQTGPEGWAIFSVFLQRRGGGSAVWKLEGIQLLIPLLFFLWLGGFLLFWLRRALAYVRLRRLLRNAPDCEDPALTDAVRKEAAYRGITEPIPVKLLPEPLPRLGVVSPCAVGFKAPMLVLPLSQWEGLSDAEREAVIDHEVFHIKKRDNWRNLWLLLLESLLWFAPAVRFALRRARQDLEYLRDRQLVREPLSPAAARDYAGALVSVASRSGPYRSALHCGMLSGCGLGLRIGLLTEAEGRRSRLLAAVYLLLVLALLAAALLLRLGASPIRLDVVEYIWMLAES